MVSGGEVAFDHNATLMKFVLTLPASLADGEVLRGLTLSADVDDWLILSYDTEFISSDTENKVTAYMMFQQYDELFIDEKITITLETNQYRYTFTKTLNKLIGYRAGKAYTFTSTIGTEGWTTQSLILDGNTTAEEITPVGDTYTINTPGQLLWFRNQVNSSNEFWSKTVKLATDIYLAEDTWIPIAADNYENRFRGTFDGGGHTISGTMKGSGSIFQFGFFGFVDNGKIIDLNVDADIDIENLGIETPNSDITIGSIVGFIVNFNATITGCTASGDIRIGITSSNLSNIYIGGIVGSIENSSIVHTSHYKGTMNTHTGGKIFVGLLVGLNGGKVYNCCTPNKDDVESGFKVIGHIAGDGILQCNEGHTIP